jgi:hypothetical protein
MSDAPNPATARAVLGMVALLNSDETRKFTSPGDSSETESEDVLKQVSELEVPRTAISRALGSAGGWVSMSSEVENSERRRPLSSTRYWVLASNRALGRKTKSVEGVSPATRTEVVVSGQLLPFASIRRTN